MLPLPASLAALRDFPALGTGSVNGCRPPDRIVHSIRGILTAAARRRTTRPLVKYMSYDSLFMYNNNALFLTRRLPVLQ